jgi:hypothetical protein
MKDPVSDYVLKKLSGAVSEDEIIYSVCQKWGWPWEKAQALVEQVKLERRAEIDARQAPVKGMLAMVFNALGVLLIVGPLVYLWVMLDITSTFLVFLSHGLGRNTETAIKLLGSRCALLGWFELPAILFTILVGFAILSANLRSLRGIWVSFLRK